LKIKLAEYKGRILFVGMSVMVTQIPFALETSKIVKGCDGEIPVVWGGPHPTLYPEQTLKNENVDIVAINEGTYTALSLAKSLRNNKGLEDIKGIGYKDSNGSLHFTPPSELEDINVLPFFDFSLIEIGNYLNADSNSIYNREFPNYKGDLRVMPILTGLGCPYRCQFCINVILKRRYRSRSAASIVNEIKRLEKLYGANTFLFLDEDFFINKKRILELVSICEEEGLHFNFRTWCRVDHFKDSYLNNELLGRLSRIGHISLAMGGESANIDMLEALNKGITPEQIMHSLKVITDVGGKIFPRYSFMVGLENETMEQIRNTYRFCMEMKKINAMVDIAGPFIFRLYPGSPIFNRLVGRYNIKVPESLEVWSRHVSNIGSADEMPWVPDKFNKNKHIIAFYSSYGLSYVGNTLKEIKYIVRIILARLSCFRIKHFFFRFPFEYWMYTFLKSKM